MAVAIAALIAIVWVFGNWVGGLIAIGAGILSACSIMADPRRDMRRARRADPPGPSKSGMP
jgi:hypothetical protein